MSRKNGGSRPKIICPQTRWKLATTWTGTLGESGFPGLRTLS